MIIVRKLTEGHQGARLPVDEDTDSGDGESSVQSLDTVRLEGLGVDIDETVELSLSALALGVIGQPGPGVVQRVDEQQGAGTSHSSAQDVHGELLGLAGVLRGGEGDLDGVLEGEVERLGGEVPEDVGQVSYNMMMISRHADCKENSPLQRG